jgi:hypothetical protein
VLGETRPYREIGNRKNTSPLGTIIHFLNKKNLEISRRCLPASIVFPARVIVGLSLHVFTYTFL